MKPFLIIAPLFILSSSAVFAQETNTAESAASGLQLSSQTDEERVEFLLQVAQAYVQDKEYESAINAYERVLKIDPENKQARYIVATVYINAKQYQKAEEMHLALLADFPDDFQILNNLAWLYATAEDPDFRDGEKAVKMAQEAMVMAPNDHHVWSTLSEAYYVTGEYEKALRAITQMARLASRYGQGITQQQVDDYNEQIKKCKRAMDAHKAISGEKSGDSATNTTAEAAQ